MRGMIGAKHFFYPALALMTAIISGCYALGFPETSNWYKEYNGVYFTGYNWGDYDTSGDQSIPPQVLNHDVSNLSLALQGYALSGKVFVCRPTETPEGNSHDPQKDDRYSLLAVFEKVGPYHPDLLVPKGTVPATHRITRYTRYPGRGDSVMPIYSAAPGGGTYVTYHRYNGHDGYASSIETEYKGTYPSEDSYYYVWRRDPKQAKLQALGFAVIEGNNAVLKKLLTMGGDVNAKPFKDRPRNDEETPSWWEYPVPGTTPGTMGRPIIGGENYPLLELAMINGQVATVKMLVGRGATPVKDYDMEYGVQYHMSTLPQDQKAAINKIVGIQEE